MNKEAIEKYLELNAAPQGLKDYLLGAEVGEEFDFDKTLIDHQTERVQFFHEKYSSDIIKKHEEATKEGVYLDTVNPIRRKLIKVGGFTSEDAEGKSPKELIEMLEGRHQKQINESAKTTNEELQTKIEEYQNKYLESHTSLTALQNDFEAKINSIKAEEAKSRESYIVNDKYMRLINKGDVDFVIPTDTAADLIKMKIMSYGYKLELSKDGELTVKAKDGGVPIDFSGNNKFESPLRLVQEIAAKDGLLKNSNGGEQAKLAPNEYVANGVKVNSDSTNWLAQQLG